MPINDCLPQEFYHRPTIIVARELIGTYLVQSTTSGLQKYMITEVEAYDGPHDLACHGRFGCTPRTAPLFGPPGIWYLYLIYGMYWMLNIVTGPQGYPAAVLIRGVHTLNGPGKITKCLGITKLYNTQPATPETGLWISPKHHSPKIIATPRIGIDYAGPIWAQKKYRFIMS